MDTLILAKLFHIASAILFIGCVYYRTFILPRARLALNNGQIEALESALAPRTRMSGKINNMILLISGVFLAYVYFDPTNVLFLLKIVFGLIVIAMFLCAPLIMHHFEGAIKQRLKKSYHYVMFSFMIVIVFLSQTMFTF